MTAWLGRGPLGPPGGGSTATAGGGFHFGEPQKPTFPKLFLALSRDVDTGSSHRASDALRRCKSGTGLSSAITSAAPGIILVIAALSLIHCQTFGGNDDEWEDCAQLPAYTGWRQKRPFNSGNPD